MKSVQPLQSFDRIKLLADSRRLEILRRLMTSPATLTQLARSLGQSPAWIRHHLKVLETVGLVRLSSVSRNGRVTEKYYSAAAGAFLLERLILPKSRVPVAVFSGSHDLALQAAADRVSKRQVVLAIYVGSLNGLTYLRQGICHVSGMHLLDESGEYNAPYLRHFFPDRDVELVTVAHRTQGLMIAPGNPRSLRGIQDLTRPSIRFVNRNAGSGTRLMLDRAIKHAGIPSAAINGYQRQVCTHTEAADLIAAGKADAAIGLQAAARSSGLDFLPMFDERYDLALPREHERELAPLLEYLQTAAYRQSTAAMTGYNTAHSGEQILL
jgi:molybdopterin molybdotransferase/putative molybdopterin biosynthesis protein